MLLVDTGAERTLLTETAVDRLHLPRDYQHATRTYGIGSPPATWDASIAGRADPRRHALPGGQHHRRPLRHDALRRRVRPTGCWEPTSCWRSTSISTCRTTASHCTAPAAGAPRPGRPGRSPISTSPASPRERDRLLVPFELDGVAGLGVLDTGAQLSSISVRMAERIGLVEDELAGDGTVMAHGAAPDQVAVRIHRFRELRVGPTVMHEPTLPVVPMTRRHGRCAGGRRLPARTARLAVVCHEPGVRHADRAECRDCRGAIGRGPVVSAAPAPSPRRPWAGRSRGAARSPPDGSPPAGRWRARRTARRSSTA